MSLRHGPEALLEAVEAPHIPTFVHAAPQPWILADTAHGQVLATHHKLIVLTRCAWETGMFLKVPGLSVDSYTLLTRYMMAYQNALRVKSVRLPFLLRMLLSSLKTAYAVFLFPQLVAYAMVMSLSSEELHSIWTSPGYILAFVVVVMLNLVYYTGLHLVARQLEDPFEGKALDVNTRRVLTNLAVDVAAIARRDLGTVARETARRHLRP